MKTKLLTSLAVFLVCGFGLIVFADHHEKDEDMNKLVFPEKYTKMSVSAGGKITGVVKFNGEIPEKKKLEITKDEKVCGAEDKFDESLVVGEGNVLKNTIVYLIDISKGKDFDKEAKIEIDQKGCKFTPHVQIVPVGARIAMLNTDKINHNVHIFNKINKSVNKQQPKTRRKIQLAAVKKAEGPVEVKCDIHGWMKAWIAYVPHPYFAVTNEKGEFTLEDVPAGTYKLGYWHEYCGSNVKDPMSVTVKSGEETKQNFSVKVNK